jgi:hypothetical protein
MNIHVMTDGAGGYRLLSAENDLVGWVRGRVVGVSGFTTRDRAVDAAVSSYRVLARWLAQQALQPLPSLGEGKLRVAHDGAHQWILCDRIRVARLPDVTSNPSNDSPCHSFEIVLDGAVSEGRAIHAGLIAVGAAQGRIVADDVTRPRRGIHSAEMAMIAPTTHVPLEER